MIKQMSAGDQRRGRGSHDTPPSTMDFPRFTLERWEGGLLLQLARLAPIVATPALISRAGAVARSEGLEPLAF
jgi:hypothetical protein